MSARLMLSAAILLAAACSSPAAPPPAANPASAPAASAPTPAGPTPTAQLAKPVVPASPSPSPSPAAQANPPRLATSPNAVRFRVAADRSEASYIAREKFIERPLPNDAIGKTRDLSGDILLDGADTLRGRVVGMKIDLRTLKSDSERRDNFVRRNVLQTDQFPFVEFESSELAGPATYTDGEEVSFKLPGTLTVRGQQKLVTWDATAKRFGDTISGTAVVAVKLSGMGVPSPTIANMLSVDDDMKWRIELVAERVPDS